LREKGSIRADEVTVQAMRDKGLEPPSDYWFQQRDDED